MWLSTKDADSLLRFLFAEADSELLRQLTKPISNHNSTCFRIGSDSDDNNNLILWVHATSSTSTEEIQNCEKAIEDYFQARDIHRQFQLCTTLNYLSLSSDELCGLVKQSRNENAINLYKKLELEQSIERAVQDIPKNKRNTAMWAIALNKRITEGTYFPTEALLELSDKDGFLYRCQDRNGRKKLSEHTLSEIFLHHPEILELAVETIKNLGFRRLSFLDNGAFSFAFEGINDESDKGQLVLLTPEGQNYIPHPMMLPAIQATSVEHEGRKILVRVMPQLKIEGVTDDHLQTLIEMITGSGLDICRARLNGIEIPDIRKENVGLYTYVNDAGIEVTIPFILDWGAVLWPNGQRPSEEELKRWQARWDKMDELEPWREAQRHMAKQHQGQNVHQAQNVYTEDQLLTLYDFSADTLQVEAFTQHGLYPNELNHLASIAWKMCDGVQGNFDSNLQTLIAAHDKSRNPNKII